MIFTYFSTKDSKGRVFCALINNAIGKELSGTLPDGTSTTVTIKDESDVKNYFGDSTNIFTITTIDNLLGKHEVEIEQKLMVMQGNKMVRQGERYNAVLMDVAIKEWTLSEPKTEEGFLSLPAVVGSAILTSVTNHLFGFDFPGDTKN